MGSFAVKSISSGCGRGLNAVYWVYMLLCGDGSLYTGMTDNLERRVAAHNCGKGAKYTRGRGPVRVVYQEMCPDKSSALRREWEIKRLRRSEKLKLAGGPCLR